MSVTKLIQTSKIHSHIAVIPIFLNTFWPCMILPSVRETGMESGIQFFTVKSTNKIRPADMINNYSDALFSFLKMIFSMKE